jgi:hypothetical protein
MVKLSKAESLFSKTPVTAVAITLEYTSKSLQSERGDGGNARISGLD